MHRIIMRNLKIFCYSAAIKAVMMLLKSKFNIFKVFNNAGQIFKFAMSISIISANFLLMIWTAEHIHKIKIMKELFGKFPMFGKVIYYLEYIVAGMMSSRTVMWMEPGDRTFLKILLYMRAFEAA